MQPKLRHYTFSTIAWKSMGRSITAFQRAEAQRMQAEQCYLERMPRKNPMEQLEDRLFLHDLSSAASRPQYELAALRLQGYSIAETAKQRGMTPKRVRRLLKELHRVYFQLYPREI